MKTKLHLFNRDAQEIETTCKNLSQNVNDFIAILYENTKMVFFYLKFLVFGPPFYERQYLHKFLIKVNSDTKLKCQSKIAERNLLGIRVPYASYHIMSLLLYYHFTTTLLVY